jgi:Kdo2-lipid IVA lauroyltransferase/acyltransferase
MIQIKDFLSCTLLRFCAIFSLPSLYRVATLISHGLMFIPNSTRRVTDINIGLCYPSLSAEEKRQWVRNSLKATACVAVEMGPLWLWPPVKLIQHIRRVEGKSLFDEAIASGRGVIVLAPHFGNWEMLNVFISQHHTLYAMYKPHPYPKLDALIRQSRERVGTITAPANQRGVATVRKALKTGGMTGILPDQVPATDGAVLAPFFGVPAQSMRLLPSLANKSGAVVIAGVAQRLEDGHFAIHFLPVSEDIYSDDMALATRAMNAAVEACVAIDPAQYQWEYKRFKGGGGHMGDPYA